MFYFFTALDLKKKYKQKRSLSHITFLHSRTNKKNAQTQNPIVSISIFLDCLYQKNGKALSKEHFFLNKGNLKKKKKIK